MHHRQFHGANGGLKWRAFWELCVEWLQLFVLIVYCVEGNMINTSDDISLSDEIYEKMYHILYDYYFGKISFLELLSKWEGILQIQSALRPSG